MGQLKILMVAFRPILGKIITSDGFDAVPFALNSAITL